MVQCGKIYFPRKWCVLIPKWFVITRTNNIKSFMLIWAFFTKRAQNAAAPEPCSAHLNRSSLQSINDKVRRNFFHSEVKCAIITFAAQDSWKYFLKICSNTSVKTIGFNRAKQLNNFLVNHPIFKIWVCCSKYRRETVRQKRRCSVR